MEVHVTWVQRMAHPEDEYRNMVGRQMGMEEYEDTSCICGTLRHLPGGDFDGNWLQCERC